MENPGRFRTAADIKSRVTGDIRELNRRLLEVAIRIDSEARAHAVSRTPQGRVLTSFFRKAVNSSRAIEALKRDRLVEEAWILLRVLLETHVNFFYFLQNDATEMTHRYADASMLDKLKHLREVNFYEGTSLAHLNPRAKWEATEAEIAKRYDSATLKGIRRNGFTGRTFEDRAKAVGLKTMYEACYRIASRSVHMFDPAETSLYEDYSFRGRPSEKRELLRARREQLESNQNMLLGRMSLTMAAFIKSTFAEAELVLLGLGYEKFRDNTSGPSEPEPDAEPDSEGSLWVFRE